MGEVGHIQLEPRWKTQALQLFTLMLVKLATLRCFRKFLKYCSGTIIFHNFCIKSGNLVTLAEASALRFIAKHTSIHVPTVYHAFVYRKKTYILMERVRGETIAKSWTSLPDTSKTSIFDQLRRIVEELRSVPSGTTGVSNVDGGPIHDCRLPRKPSWGPFNTISEFHLALRNNVTAKSRRAERGLN